MSNVQQAFPGLGCREMKKAGIGATTAGQVMYVLGQELQRIQDPGTRGVP